MNSFVSLLKSVAAYSRFVVTKQKPAAKAELFLHLLALRSPHAPAWRGSATGLNAQVVR
jgi:hypothetical protein